MRYAYLIWRNLLRKKIRTSLTLLSVFVAFLLFGVLVAIRTAFGAGIELAGLDRMITIHKVSLIQLLPENYGHKMAAVEGVAAVGHATWFGGIYKDPKYFFAKMAVDPAYIELYPEMNLPAEQKEAWLANRTGAIVGRTLADRFGWKLGDRIPIQGDIWRREGDAAWEFTIDGIYNGDESFDNTQMFFHDKYLTEGTGIEGLVGWYVLKIADPERSAEIAERVDAVFANSQAETKTSTEKAFVQAFANQAGNIGAIAVGIVSVVFFTLLLVIGNTMAQSVRERISELGVLKTLGFTGTQLMGLVLAESYLLTLLGGGAGLGLIVFATRQFDIGGSLLPVFYVPWKDAAIGAVLLVAMGFAAAAVPAWQALRLPIVDALRRS